jgi:hypothetical protein
VAKPPAIYRSESFEEVGSLATWVFSYIRNHSIYCSLKELWKPLYALTLSTQHITDELLSCSICRDISQNAISNVILDMFSPLVSLTTLWAFLWMCFHSNFFFIILANRYIKPAREQPTVVSFSFSGNNQTWKITILSLLPNLWDWQGRV